MATAGTRRCCRGPPIIVVWENYFAGFLHKNLQKFGIVEIKNLQKFGIEEMSEEDENGGLSGLSILPS
jgi:hypothetical protein